MSRVLNEKPFKYSCSRGIVFTAERCDFVGGVTARIPVGLSEVEVLQGVAQMIGFHAGNILPELNGFAGYDCISFVVEHEVAPPSSMIPQQGGWLDMRVVEFFSRQRFIELGVAPRVATRAHRSVRKMCTIDYLNMRRPLSITTMRGFLGHYNCRALLGGVPDFGKLSKDAVVLVIKSAGLPFPD